MEVKWQSLAVKYAKALYKSLSNRTGARRQNCPSSVSCLTFRSNDPSMLTQTNDKYTQLILSNRKIFPIASRVNRCIIHNFGEIATEMETL